MRYAAHEPTVREEVHEPVNAPARRTARPNLDRAGVIAMAQEMARRDGMQAVTISGVARSLDVTPMALYRHVGDADRLVESVIDAIYDEIVLPEHASGEEGLAQFVATLRSVYSHYAKYSGLAELLLAQGTLATPASLRIAEWFLPYFQESGRDRRHAAMAFETFRQLFLVSLIQRRPPKALCHNDVPPDISESLLAAVGDITAEDRFDFAIELFLKWAQKEPTPTHYGANTKVASSAVGGKPPSLR